MKPAALIRTWLAARLPAPALAWLDEKAAAFAAVAPDKVLFPAFSAAVRHSGKAPLSLSDADLAAAEAAVEGWNPSDWTLDQAARILLLASLPGGPDTARILLQMHQTADIGESVALQKSLPLLPDPTAHMHWAREGIRSNLKGVYEAIVLRNPYPARHFDEIGWNQLVSKTFFMESPLEAVWGLDSRANAALAQILTDLAYERWAAGRTFSPQLWRCVGPFARAVPGNRGLKALETALAGKTIDAPPGQLGTAAPGPGGREAHRRAAALALVACKDPEAARILASAPDLAVAARSGALTWENLNARPD